MCWEILLSNGCRLANSHHSLGPLCKLNLDISSTTLSLKINKSYLKIYNIAATDAYYVFMAYKSGPLNLTLANDGPV